jgi:acyl-CoA thioesterase FadM
MLLRLWWTIASGLVKPRKGPLDECRVALRVWPNDLDSNLHMNNSRYLLAMDLGRWDCALRTGLIQQALRRRWFPVAGSVMLRFRKSLDPFQRFELRTRVVGWDEKWFWFEQRFEVDGRLHAVGRVKALLRGAEGSVPTAAVLAALGRADAAPPDLPQAIRLWQQVEASDAQSGAAT